MQYTEKQKAEFRDKFFQRRLYHVASFVPVAGAVFMLLLSERYIADLGLPLGTWALGTAALVFAAAGFSWLNWRCPACEKYLGRGLSPAQCPKCGVAFK